MKNVVINKIAIKQLFPEFAEALSQNGVGDINDTSKGFYLNDSGEVLIKQGGANSNYVQFNGGKVVIKTDPLSLDTSGNLIVSGTLSSSIGNIGGWTIETDRIVSPNDRLELDVVGGTNQVKIAKTSVGSDGADYVRMYFTDTSNYGLQGYDGGNQVFHLGSTNQIAGFTFNSHSLTTTGVEINNSTQDIFISSSNFKVSHAGNITASNVDLSGKITATSGEVGGFTIDGHSLTTTGVEINDSTQPLFINTSNFDVSHAGNITASNVDVSGVITASAGLFSGNVTSEATMSGGTIVTSTASERVEVDGVANDIKFITAGSPVIAFGKLGQLADIGGGKQGRTSYGLEIQNDEAQIFIKKTSTTFAAGLPDNADIMRMSPAILAELNVSNDSDTNENGMATILGEFKHSSNAFDDSGIFGGVVGRVSGSLDNSWKSAGVVGIDVQYAGLPLDSWADNMLSKHYGLVSIGDAAIDGNLLITGSGNVLSVSGSVDIGGPITSNITASNDISASGIIKGLSLVGNTVTGVDIIATGDIDVDGTANLDNTDIDGTLDVSQTLTVGSNISTTGNILGDGATTITNIASVTATGTIQAEQITSTDDMSVTDDLTVGGNINLADNIVHTGDTDTKIVFGTNNIYFHTGTNSNDKMNITSTAVVINQDAQDFNFRVEGTGSQYLLFTDAGNNRVGIGDAVPNQLLGIKGTNAQISIEEDDNEFIRIGVGETEGDAVIGWDDGTDLHLGVYDSPTDTSITSRMKITQEGYVGIGTSADPDRLFEVEGEFGGGYALTKITHTGTTDDNNNDVMILRTSVETNADSKDRFLNFLGTGTSYLGSIKGDGSGGVDYTTSFTGKHASVMKSGSYETGMIVESTGEVWGKRDDGTHLHTGLPKVQITTTNSSKKVYGIVGELDNYDTYGGHNDNFGVGSDEIPVTIHSIGEGLITITNINGNVENGDYIVSSDIAGYGQKQDDDILRSSTVAKCTETIDWDNVTDTITHNGVQYKKYTTTCTYHCG